MGRRRRALLEGRKGNRFLTMYYKVKGDVRSIESTFVRFFKKSSNTINYVSFLYTTSPLLGIYIFNTSDENKASRVQRLKDC